MNRFLELAHKYNDSCEEKVTPVQAFYCHSRQEKCIELQFIRLKKCVPHLNNAIKLGQYNVGRKGEILTVPLYMGFFIKDTLTEVIVPDIDMSLLN
jgi:hypothetical protein